MIVFPPMAVVEIESFASWEWFLQTLKDELGIDNTYPWTIMTDKQKGLILAVKSYFLNQNIGFVSDTSILTFRKSSRGRY